MVDHTFSYLSKIGLFGLTLVMMVMLVGCAQVDVPGARHLKVPAPKQAIQKPDGINERPDSVLYLPLGEDVLVPKAEGSGSLPDEIVGPFELRSETLAGALQLILADYEVPLAFETEEGLSRTITVANLRGPLGNVVEKICGLADLYCSFEDGLLVVKERQTFSVTIPPIGADDGILEGVAAGLAAILNGEQDPVIDEGTRTIIYEASSRTSRMAERYFQRLRANTALIIFEVYIWEVTLNSENSTGIDWENIDVIADFTTGISIPGGSTALNPISIGLPTTGGVAFDGDDVLEFISTYGAVKTISQPQITVLSGAESTLRAADTSNFVSSVTRSIEDGETTVSTETDSVDTGFTLTVSSDWDNATVYSTIELELQELRGFVDFSAEGTEISLPETTERELSTQVRIRPGDSLLIAGLVRENDEYDSSGAGFMEPFLPTSRTANTSNTELVVLMRPRVVVYTDDPQEKKRIYERREKKLQGKSEQESLKIEAFPIGTVSPDMLDPSM